MAPSCKISIFLLISLILEQLAFSPFNNFIKQLVSKLYLQ